jgi:nucleoside-diphosphate-sugar epimerase
VTCCQKSLSTGAYDYKARRAFIIGGTGQIGQAVVSDLLAQGWSVTVSCRGIRPVSAGLAKNDANVVRLDREEPGALASALVDGATIAMPRSTKCGPTVWAPNRRCGPGTRLRTTTLLSVVH